MKNMLKKRYETPEAELLELLTEDFILYNDPQRGEEFDDGDY